MKYVLIVLGCLAFLVGVVWLLGYVQPVEHQASVSRQIQAPKAEIWNKITSPGSFSSWRTNVTDTEVYSDSTEALHWKETYSDNDPLTFKEIQRTDSTVFVSRIADEGLPFGGQWTINLESIDSSTTEVTITEEGEIYSAVFRFFARFVFGYEGTINQYLSDLETSF